MAMNLFECYLMGMNQINAHELNARFLFDHALLFCSANIGHTLYIFIIIMDIKHNAGVMTPTNVLFGMKLIKTPMRLLSFLCNH